MSKSYALTEYESKNLLNSYGLRTTREVLVYSVEEAIEQSSTLGFPVVLKASGEELLHKSDLGGVKLNLDNEDSVRNAARGLDTEFGFPLLVSEQVESSREFIAGVTRSDEYGLVLAFGVGGVFAEIIQDVIFRLLPATKRTIRSMFDELLHRDLLGQVRGETEIDLEQLTEALVSIGECAMDREDIISIDVNPLLINDGMPIAVDALVELYDR